MDKISEKMLKARAERDFAADAVAFLQDFCSKRRCETCIFKIEAGPCTIGEPLTWLCRPLPKRRGTS